MPVLTKSFVRKYVHYYMKFSRHVNFANFAIHTNSQILSDANNKCREQNMTRKLSDSRYVNDSHYVYSQERTNLLPLKRLQNDIFFTVLSNVLVIPIATAFYLLSPGSTSFVQSSNCPFNWLSV